MRILFCVLFSLYGCPAYDKKTRVRQQRGQRLLSYRIPQMGIGNQGKMGVTTGSASAEAAFVT